MIAAPQIEIDNERKVCAGRERKFLRELAAALDALPEQELIAGELFDEAGACCALGAVVLARGVDMAGVNAQCARTVADFLSIPRCLAAEIEFQNDQDFTCAGGQEITAQQRWRWMRKWVARRLESGRQQ